jgi:hypothetical protein
LMPIWRSLNAFHVFVSQLPLPLTFYYKALFSSITTLEKKECYTILLLVYLLLWVPLENI